MLALFLSPLIVASTVRSGGVILSDSALMITSMAGGGSPSPVYPSMSALRTYKVFS